MPDELYVRWVLRGIRILRRLVYTHLSLVRSRYSRNIPQGRTRYSLNADASLSIPGGGLLLSTGLQFYGSLLAVEVFPFGRLCSALLSSPPRLSFLQAKTHQLVKLPWKSLYHARKTSGPHNLRINFFSRDPASSVVLK
ncbi:hypothetical protein MIND_00692600 [Mycena indigotica]|uniref:Uncharacterized protein n=1 Tax=Mycena indigotica TaxID=2126181 RepID=A0A8H6W4B8_9AGAR|nr:uncharacterized protein MIND_00692600 [Mycena indigotica]KAF7301278.1 hypothetical protein MIND_00692600 [Mycena indigotica]